MDVDSSNPTLLRVYEASRRHVLEESNLYSVRIYHGIFLEGLRKRTKDLCRVWLSPDRVLNVEPLEYVSGMLPIKLPQLLVVLRCDEVMRHFIRTEISLTALRIACLLS